MRTSTLDLAGRGVFTLLTGIGGEAWASAAADVCAARGLAYRVVVVGPGQEVEDPYGLWADLRETDDGGLLVVRPDLYVAARHQQAPTDAGAATAWLRDVLDRVLGEAVAAS